MIYFFTWNSDYLVREKTKHWRDAYIEKYGDFNFTHLKDLKNLDNNLLSQELLSWWFMWEKKLILINDFPLSSSIKDWELSLKQDFLESILEKIPEDNIVVFSSVSPDKRSKLYKKLKEISTKVEEFSISWNSSLFPIISNEYKNKLDSNALNLLINYKSWNLDKIIAEIDKLLILSDRIDENMVKQNIFPELEESIFHLIDDIMNKNFVEIFNKIDIILSQVSVYAFYNNLISNLRVLVYIDILKNKNISSISEVLNLWNRAFLVNKNYAIGSRSLNDLYVWLIDLDKKMKSWSMIWSEDEVLKYEIEKCLLKMSK